MTKTDLLSGKSILVVEDEYLAAIEMKAMLEGLGCTVPELVADQAAAQQSLKAQDVDAILLDVRLKGGDQGYTIADDAIAQGIPVVFVTGFDIDTLPDRFQATPHLDKPVQKDRLKHVLADLFAEE